MSAESSLTGNYSRKYGGKHTDDIGYVRIYISHLQQKIEEDPSQPRYIITDPGVDYYFRKNDTP
jgi:two-component system KDP operon response regulator KdpE